MRARKSPQVPAGRGLWLLTVDLWRRHPAADRPPPSALELPGEGASASDPPAVEELAGLFDAALAAEGSGVGLLG